MHKCIGFPTTKSLLGSVEIPKSILAQRLSGQKIAIFLLLEGHYATGGICQVSKQLEKNNWCRQVQNVHVTKILKT